MAASRKRSMKGLTFLDEIANSLQGNWRAEHLFALKQALNAFDFCCTQLAECDALIQVQLQALQEREDEPAQGKKRGRARNAPKFALRTQLFHSISKSFLTRREAADSAQARQGEATTSGVI